MSHKLTATLKLNHRLHCLQTLSTQNQFFIEMLIVMYLDCLHHSGEKL
jgi:hypothetical protein